MGMQTEAKKGTVIEVGGVRIEVLRGSPQLEISAPAGTKISILVPSPITVRKSSRTEEGSDNELHWA
jgi:hypothetical protein